MTSAVIRVYARVQMQKLAPEIRRRRRAADLTQADLAGRVGVSQRTIVAYESGSAFPRADVLALMADIFACTLDELTGREAGAAA